MTACAVLLLSSVATTAAQLPIQGTIQSLQQDEGIIRIPARDLNYRDGVVTITLGDREMNPQYLTEGMVVRYTLNAQGYLDTIKVLAVRDLVKEVDNN